MDMVRAVFNSSRDRHKVKAPFLPAPFAEEIILIPFYDLNPFLKKQLAVLHGLISGSLLFIYHILCEYHAVPY